MKKQGSVSGVIRLILGLLLAVGCQTFIQPCIHEDGNYGSCHMAGQVLTGMGIAIVIVALVLLFAAASLRLYADLVMLLLALVSAFVPGKIISLCMMSTMRCLSIMKPAALLITGVIALLCVLDLITVLRGSKRSIDT